MLLLPIEDLLNNGARDRLRAASRRHLGFVSRRLLNHYAETFGAVRVAARQAMQDARPVEIVTAAYARTTGSVSVQETNVYRPSCSHGRLQYPGLPPASYLPDALFDAEIAPPGCHTEQAVRRRVVDEGGGCLLYFGLVYVGIYL